MLLIKLNPLDKDLFCGHTIIDKVCLVIVEMCFTQQMLNTHLSKCVRINF